MPLLGHHAQSCGVGQNKLGSLRRVSRRDWHVGTTGFQHRQHTDDHFQTAIQIQHYRRVCRHRRMAPLLIAFPDHNRQLVRLFIDLPVGQRYPRKYQRHVIRCGCRARLELLLQGLVLRVRYVGLIPAVQQGMALLCGQHVNPGQRLLLIRHKRR